MSGVNGDVYVAATAKGNCLDDWTDNLRFKKDKEMDIWINDRQAENPALTSLMDEYVCFAWRTTAEPLNQASSIVMQGI